MSYSTGFAVDREGLLEVIKNFAEANGWVTNQFIVKGTGKLLCLQKVTGLGHTVYVNLRSANNEDASFWSSSGGSAKLTGVAVSISTGYNSSKDFYNQPGSPTRLTNDAYFYASNIHSVNQVATYWLFGFTNPDTIACIVQLPDGTYRHLMFGDITKTTAFTGGQFFTGSSGATTSVIASNGLPFEFEDNDSNPRGTGFINVDLDSRAGWWDTTCGFYSTPPGNHLELPGCVAGARLLDNLALDNSRNLFAGVGVLFPIELFAWYTSVNKFKPIGFIPWVRTCLNAAFNPGEIITLGADSWMILPSVSVGGKYALAYRYIV